MQILVWLSIWSYLAGEDERLALKLKEIERNKNIMRNYHTDDIRAVKALFANICKSTGYLKRDGADSPTSLYGKNIINLWFLILMSCFTTL